MSRLVAYAPLVAVFLLALLLGFAGRVLLPQPQHRLSVAGVLSSARRPRRLGRRHSGGQPQAPYSAFFSFQSQPTGRPGILTTSTLESCHQLCSISSYLINTSSASIIL